MKKGLLFALTVLCLVSMDSIAQDRKGYIGLSGGLSVPVGKFGSNNINDADAGFAEVGLRFNLINFGYTFGGGFGIAANWMGTAHPVTVNAGFTTFNGTWAYGSLMAGPMYTLNVSDKIDIDFKALVGLTVLTLDIDGDSQDADGLGINIGSTFRFNFADRWCVLTNLDYFTSKPEFENGGEQKIASINLTGGIGFRL